MFQQYVMTKGILFGQVMVFGQALLPILSGVLNARHLDMPLSQLCQVCYSMFLTHACIW